MFVVLRTVHPETGFINKRRQRKILRLCEPVAYPSENGLPFYILDVLNEKSGIDRELTEEKCGKYVSRIVAPRSIILPDNGKLKRFVPQYSSGFFLFNTALDAINSARPDPEKICITVIDRNGIMTGEILRLLPFSSLIRIVTACPERYSPVCHAVYEEFGASLIIRPSYEPCERKDIVICCSGTTTQEMINAAVFSYRRGVCGFVRFFCSGITLSQSHKAIIPSDVLSSDFASALIELCASTEYKLSGFSETETNCVNCRSSSASECLKCYIYGDSKK